MEKDLGLNMFDTFLFVVDTVMIFEEHCSVNFEVIVLSKERNLERSALYLIGWLQVMIFAFVERFEQQSRSLVIFQEFILVLPAVLPE